MSKKRTFKELLQLLPQKEQPEDKAEKEAAEPALQGSEAENAAAAVQHENAYAKLGKAFINRLHLPQMQTVLLLPKNSLRMRRKSKTL